MWGGGGGEGVCVWGVLVVWGVFLGGWVRVCGVCLGGGCLGEGYLEGGGVLCVCVCVLGGRVYARFGRPVYKKCRPSLNPQAPHNHILCRGICRQHLNPSPTINPVVVRGVIAVKRGEGGGSSIPIIHPFTASSENVSHRLSGMICIILYDETS